MYSFGSLYQQHEGGHRRKSRHDHGGMWDIHAKKKMVETDLDARYVGDIELGIEKGRRLE